VNDQINDMFEASAPFGFRIGRKLARYSNTIRNPIVYTIFSTLTWLYFQAHSIMLTAHALAIGGNIWQDRFYRGIAAIPDTTIRRQLINEFQERQMRLGSKEAYIRSLVDIQEARSRTYYIVNGVGSCITLDTLKIMPFKHYMHTMYRDLVYSLKQVDEGKVQPTNSDENGETFTFNRVFEWKVLISNIVVLEGDRASRLSQEDYEAIHKGWSEALIIVQACAEEVSHSSSASPTGAVTPRQFWNIILKYNKLLDPESPINTTDNPFPPMARDLEMEEWIERDPRTEETVS
jgi:hypothetical protein